ncbi:hypothetical protein LTR22_023151 [Elasticomyces elasticus]|nr:hypothetical protein LTR22_023151 [Elasticomyces elasticus]
MTALSYDNLFERAQGKPNFSNMNIDIGNESFSASLYPAPWCVRSEYSVHEKNVVPGFPKWSTDDPLQANVNSLTHYCIPHGADAQQCHTYAPIVGACLTVDNIKHFAEHYTSYQGHWPILHMSISKLTEATTGLGMAMMYISAVYISRLQIHEVRQMTTNSVKTRVISNGRYSDGGL